MSARKRILFVDDEPPVLQGLQRMLRHMNDSWEMIFVGSAADGLSEINKEPFDVVVSDVRMPGMNGAEFLAEVQRCHPNTARLALASQADQELVMDKVGAIHQFLAKPCDAEVLRSTICRASDLETTLRTERIMGIVSQMDRLPSLPSLYVKVVEELQQPEVSLEDIADLIARDIGMTAKILKLVNSAFVGLRRQISSPIEAVNYLGLDMIKALVLSINAFSQFETVRLGGISLESLWNHSLETASCCKVITHLEPVDGRFIDEAFVGGMLHDTGKLVLASNYPEKYAEAVHLMETEHIDVLNAEERIFGATHEEVGGFLLGLWGLPVNVVEAIGHHHSPARSAVHEFSPLTVVHVANYLVRANGDVPPLPLDVEYLEEIGVADKVEGWKRAFLEHLEQGS